MKSLFVLTACLTIIGCGAKEGSSVSTLSGTLSRSTFPSDPSQLVATNEAGSEIATEPDASGAFKLSLHKGHTYRLSVLLADSSEPVVFPRSSGVLDETFRVSSGAASVNLGLVYHLDSAPTAGFVIKSATPAGDGDGECENGIDATTGAPCVDDDGELTCEEGDEEEGEEEADGADDGECESGVDAVTGEACTDADDDGADDGECENGVDATTGEACTDPDDVDPNSPMAVAEHNVPEEVGGCDDSGEEEDDD